MLSGQGGIWIKRVYVSEVVGDDGDFFVAEGALGFTSQIGSVKPHIFGNESTIVGEYAVVHQNKVCMKEVRVVLVRQIAIVRASAIINVTVVPYIIVCVRVSVIVNVSLYVIAR